MNLSQEELAEKIYVTRQTISNWENDKSYPDIHSLLLLSSTFHISLDQLIKGDITTMKEEISKEAIQKFNRDGAIFTVLLILTVIAAVPLAVFLGYCGYIVWGILFLIMIYYALRVEKFKKENDIMTYKEIVAFTEGKQLDEIEKAQEKGIEFVVASGRDYYGVTSVLDPLGIKCSAILGNGAQYCNKEGKAIMDCYLDKEMLKEILPVFIENNTPYMIFTTNGFYSTLKPDYVRDRFAYRGSVRFGNKMEDFLPGGPMSDSPACQIQQFDSIDEFIKKDLDIIKVEAFSHDESEIQKVLPYFKDMKKIAYLSSYPDNVEITNENAQKGLILEKVIDLLNIKKEEVIVLGDGMNDITLFERFPYSFAPNNAEKVIQEKAYKVVSSCKDGAVSEAIEYALENL